MYRELSVPYLHERKVYIDKTTVAWITWFSIKSEKANERAPTALG